MQKKTSQRRYTKEEEETKRQITQIHKTADEHTTNTRWCNKWFFSIGWCVWVRKNYYKIHLFASLSIYVYGVVWCVHNFFDLDWMIIIKHWTSTTSSSSSISLSLLLVNNIQVCDVVVASFVLPQTGFIHSSIHILVMDLIFSFVFLSFLDHSPSTKKKLYHPPIVICEKKINLKTFSFNRF